MDGCAPGLALKEGLQVTRKWSIVVRCAVNLWIQKNPKPWIPFNENIDNQSKFLDFSIFGWKSRSHSDYAGEIWKRCFLSENASNVLPWYNAEEIWERNNHASFRICVSRKLRQGNQMIIVLVFKEKIPSSLKRKAGVLKFLRFEGRFWKAPSCGELVGR